MKDSRNSIERWFGSTARMLYRNPLKTLPIMLIWIAVLLSQLPKITMNIRATLKMPGRPLM